ncbi:Fumarylacetoacetase [Escovopsis weberi]|uniref:Fumarylacetoacetase n=1 Tax=Escovopsis weberi TaxID=150374 RepID=A0A0M8N3L5_ESCWE|nr:Fumarylacetoacetase [Escovopsis weberi]
MAWVPADKEGDFSIDNLPFGVFSDSNPFPRVGVRIGDSVLDVNALAGDEQAAHSLRSLAGIVGVFGHSSLNAFAALGRAVHRAVRADLRRVLAADTDLPGVLRDNAALRERALVPVERVKMHLPMQVGDYTDFYAGYHHAFKVGCLFRGEEHALQPNYTHLPVGYHGRASSVVVSGTNLRRPRGQILPAAAAADPASPVTAPSRRLDYELELGCFVCRPNEMGEPVAVDAADEHIFGYVLLNDWSARDIQAWEYIPLGPFNSKNFGSSISPWVVLADALEPFRTEPLPNDAPRQAYMDEAQKKSVFDIQLQVHLTTEQGTTNLLTETNSKNLLWSFPQMLAHHTVGGCPMRPGDLLGSGTISGTEPHQRGCLLERTEGGKVDVELGQGVVRRFLEDGDSVSIRGHCEKEHEGRVLRVGFGECVGKILPALQ